MCLFACLLLANVFFARAQENQTTCCGEWTFEEEILTLDEALQDPDKATKLDLSLQTPKLTKIPDEVTRLPNLECLLVSYNRVATFPADFTKLQKLCSIDLSGNYYLQSLPDFLNEMPNLKEIILKELKWSKEKKEATEKQFPHIRFVW